MAAKCACAGSSAKTAFVSGTATPKASSAARPSTTNFSKIIEAMPALDRQTDPRPSLPGIHKHFTNRLQMNSPWVSILDHETHRQGDPRSSALVVAPPRAVRTNPHYPASSRRRRLAIDDRTHQQHGECGIGHLSLSL